MKSLEERMKDRAERAKGTSDEGNVNRRNEGGEVAWGGSGEGAGNGGGKPKEEKK